MGEAVTDESTTTLATLASIAERLFPHPVTQAVYTDTAAMIMARIATNPKLAAIVSSGLAKLGPDFAQRSEAAQIAALAALEGGGFFEAVRNLAMFGVYNHAAIWALLGYEGSSMEHGGYIERGFDAIDWLETVPKP